MSVGKDSLKRAASAATTKETKTTRKRSATAKAAETKTATTKVELAKTETAEVKASVTTGTSKEVQEMFVPEERVSHVNAELPVYLL